MSYGRKAPKCCAINSFTAQYSIVVHMKTEMPEQGQGKGGQQERKGTEVHIQQIFIILFPEHELLYC